jgi:hypothetical protein
MNYSNFNNQFYLIIANKLKINIKKVNKNKDILNSMNNIRTINNLYKF